MTDKNKKQTLASLFEGVTRKKDKFDKVYSSWNFNSLDKFIVSFERLSEQENIETSKRYGNISKNLTKDILENDLGGIDLETNKKYTKKEILLHIKSDNFLKNNFKKLYEEVGKRNYWKLQMPLISTQYDLLLDRCSNDYERFKIIHEFYIDKKQIKAKDIKDKRKVFLNKGFINEDYKKNEVEKVFYILINKIKRKKEGKSFLLEYNLDLKNPFENS